MKKGILTAVALIFACSALFAQDAEQSVINAWNVYNKSKNVVVDKNASVDAAVLKYAENIDKKAETIISKISAYSKESREDIVKMWFKDWGNDKYSGTFDISDYDKKIKQWFPATSSINGLAREIWRNETGFYITGYQYYMPVFLSVFGNIIAPVVDVCANVGRFVVYGGHDLFYLCANAPDKIACNKADKAVESCGNIGEACKNVSCGELSQEEKTKLYKLLRTTDAGMAVILAQFALKGRDYAGDANKDIQNLIKGKDLDPKIYNGIKIARALKAKQKEMQKPKEFKSLQDLISEK